jgi:hypothetical protein
MRYLLYPGRMQMKPACLYNYSTTAQNVSAAKVEEIS